MRRLDKHPRAVAAAQVAHHQVVLLPRELRVQRRHEGVVREADVAVLPADRGVEGLAVEALHHVSHFVEEHQRDGEVRARGRRGGGAEGEELRQRRAAHGAEARARGDGRGAAPARRPRARSRQPAPAVRAERQCGADLGVAEWAGGVALQGGRGRRRHLTCAGDRRRARRRRHCGHRFRAAGLVQGFAAVHAELRAGLVVAAAIGAGHSVRCSREPISLGLPIYSANWRVERVDASFGACASEPRSAVIVVAQRHDATFHAVRRTSSCDVASWCRVALLALSLLAGRAEAQVDPSGPWRTLHTEHFRIHFRPAYRAVAEQEAREAERAYRLLAAELRAPRGVIDLVLGDDVDVANGATTVFPSSRIYVMLPPPLGDPGLQRFDSWLRLVTVHELTHVFHLDRVRGVWGVLQRVFGRAPGLFPNAFQPSWVIEGLATYYESKFTNGGRGRGRWARAGGRYAGRRARPGSLERAGAAAVSGRRPSSVPARRRQGSAAARRRGRAGLAGAAAPPRQRRRELRLAGRHAGGGAARLDVALAPAQRSVSLASRWRVAGGDARGAAGAAARRRRPPRRDPLHARGG